MARAPSPFYLRLAAPPLNPSDPLYHGLEILVPILDAVEARPTAPLSPFFYYLYNFYN